MEYEFYVIIQTPDLLEQGNTAHDFMWDGYDFTNKQKMVHVGCSKIGKPIGECRTAVFQEGEIVICSKESGREVCYPGRKPNKWDVLYEIFSDLDSAVKRAKEID